MRILFVVHSFVPFTFAGTEVYSYILSKELSKKHEVIVFCRVNDVKQKEFELRYQVYEGIPVYTINNTFKKCRNFENTYLNKTIDELFAQCLDKIKPDIVHIQHLLFLSLGVIREAKKRKIPVVFTSNDYWLFCHKGQLMRQDGILCGKPQSESCISCLEGQLSINPVAAIAYRFLRINGLFSFLRICKAGYLKLHKIMPKTVPNAHKALQNREMHILESISDIDCFVAPSEFMRQKLIENGVPVKKIVFSQYGIKRERFLANKAQSHQGIRFCFIGTLLPAKGIDRLVSEFRKLRHPNARLFIFGKKAAYAGYEGFYAQLNKAVLGDNRIKLMGGIENDLISSVYAQNDVLIVPSIWYENTPLVILEALAARVPVVAARLGGIPELIKEGVNGLLFNPHQSGDLENKLEMFFGDPQLLLRLKQGSQALRSIEENAYDMKNIYAELLAVKGS